MWFDDLQILRAAEPETTIDPSYNRRRAIAPELTSIGIALAHARKC